MADRFKNNLYMLTRYKRIEGHLCTISNDDGTLFSGCFKTKPLYRSAKIKELIMGGIPKRSCWVFFPI